MRCAMPFAVLLKLEPILDIRSIVPQLILLSDKGKMPVQEILDPEYLLRGSSTHV